MPGEQTGEAVAVFHWVQLKANMLKFRGYAMVLGEGASFMSAEQTHLLARGANEKHKFALEVLQDKSLNSGLYQDYYRDYSWGGLRTPSDQGISLATLPIGEFDLGTVFTGPSGPREAACTESQHS